MARARKSIHQINVVPYIDVMLVLLVIFMITAPLITPGAIDLPSVGRQLTVPVQPLTIDLRMDHSLWLQETPASAKLRVSRDELVARILESQARNPDQAVVIAANKDVRYEEVVSLLDILQQKGVRKVGLLVQTRPAPASK